MSEMSLPEDLKSLRQSVRTGKPFGSDLFISEMEKVAGRSLHSKKRGPKGTQVHMLSDQINFQ